MAEQDISGKQLVFTIHAVEESSAPGAPVRAKVFNAQCRAVFAALEEADKSVTPDARHEFYVTKLGTGSSAIVGVTEKAAKSEYAPRASSIGAFLGCADAIYRGNFREARRYNGLAERVLTVVKHAGEAFSYTEFEAEGAPKVRGDDFLRSQVERYLKEREETPKEAVDAVFQGQSFESFDGEIKLVDLLGNTPRGIIVLSGSKVKIECVFKNLSRDEIRACLDRRVWAEGFAIYTGKSPMPERFEITKATPIKTGGDIMAWRGVVSPAEDVDWETPFDQSH